jgi:excisionase family DNA binding protein
LGPAELSAAAKALPQKPTFSLAEASYFVGVHVNTLRNWIAAGTVEVRRTAGGHVRIDRPELEKILSKS